MLPSAADVVGRAKLRVWTVGCDHDRPTLFASDRELGTPWIRRVWRSEACSDESGDAVWTCALLQLVLLCERLQLTRTGACLFDLLRRRRGYIWTFGFARSRQDRGEDRRSHDASPAHGTPLVKPQSPGRDLAQPHEHIRHDRGSTSYDAKHRLLRGSGCLRPRHRRERWSDQNWHQRDASEYAYQGGLFRIVGHSVDARARGAAAQVADRPPVEKRSRRPQNVHGGAHGPG